MHWLTGLLAFATTMLVFAIIVSVIVETIHRLLKLRSGGMYLMLSNFYEEALAPVIEPHGNSDSRAKHAAEFAGFIMRNRAIESATGSSNLFGRGVHWLLDASQVTQIPTEVFSQKLGTYATVKNVEDKVSTEIQDLAQKYVAIGREMTIYFESRARLLSVLVAFVVAWMFYIHPYNLISSYIKNPELAQSVAETSAVAYKEYEELQKRLDSIAKQPVPVESEAQSKEFKKAVENLGIEIKKAGDETKRLHDLGVPIGWPAKQESSDCNGIENREKKGTSSVECTSYRMVNFYLLELPLPHRLADSLWLLIGGLLVGLGAPFWARAVANLTITRDVSKQISEVVSPRPQPSPQRAYSVVRPPQMEEAQSESIAVRTFLLSKGKSAPRVNKWIKMNDDPNYED